MCVSTRDIPVILNPNMKAPQSPMRRSRRGFTLLEILIAIAILGLLVGLAVVNVGNILENGRMDVANIYVKESLKPALTRYQVQHRNFPPTLDALRTNPGNLSRPWGGPYVEESAEWPPIDPWGQAYLYKTPGTRNPSSYDLWSMGPDRQDGTEDDIGNWVNAAATTEPTN